MVTQEHAVACALQFTRSFSMCAVYVSCMYVVCSWVGGVEV